MSLSPDDNARTHEAPTTQPLPEDIIATAKQLGMQASAVKHAPLVQLAMASARLAHARKIDETAAAEIYAAYITHSQGIQPDLASGSYRVNVSKLRQIIKVASQKRPNGLKLLEQVVKTHDKLASDHRSTMVLAPTYYVLVEAARAQLKSEKALTDRQIMALMKRPW